MDANEVCKQLVAQFDQTGQGHLAILGSIVLNVIMLIRVWMTTRDNAIQVNNINRKINGS